MVQSYSDLSLLMHNFYESTYRMVKTLTSSEKAVLNVPSQFELHHMF